jgi:hypothetical protein
MVIYLPLFSRPWLYRYLENFPFGGNHLASPKRSGHAFWWRDACTRQAVTPQTIEIGLGDSNLESYFRIKGLY